MIAFGDDIKILTLTVGMVAHVCEYTKAIIYIYTYLYLYLQACNMGACHKLRLVKTKC